MLKTYAFHRLDLLEPPPQHFTVSPLRSMLVWLVGSVLIGAAAGMLFGLALALLLNGTPLTAAMVGLVYAVVLSWPFGLWVGGAMAMTRTPRTQADVTSLARHIGLISLFAAGILAAVVWPLLLIAAACGVAVGWQAAPIIVRLSLRPVHRATREPGSIGPALTQQRHTLAAENHPYLRP